MENVPYWLFPIEEMSPQAIALMCDADRRPWDAMETIIVRMKPLG